MECMCVAGEDSWLRLCMRPAVQPGFCPPSCVPWYTAESAWRNGHLPKGMSFFLICTEAPCGLASVQVLLEYRRGDYCSEGSRKYMVVRWLLHIVLEGSTFAGPSKPSSRAGIFPWVWGHLKVSASVHRIRERPQSFLTCARHNKGIRGWAIKELWWHVRFKE